HFIVAGAPIDQQLVLPSIVTLPGSNLDTVGGTGERKANQQEYYETIIRSYLRRDRHRRLCPSPNHHHVVADNFKSGDKLDNKQHDKFHHGQFRDGNGLYARRGDHPRSWHRQPGSLHYW